MIYLQLQLALALRHELCFFLLLQAQQLPLVQPTRRKQGSKPYVCSIPHIVTHAWTSFLTTCDSARCRMPKHVREAVTGQTWRPR